MPMNLPPAPEASYHTPNKVALVPFSRIR
jgi:hypothetical protein